MTKDEQKTLAGDILRGMNQGPGQPVPHPGPPPDTSKLLEVAATKARGEYQAKLDAHVASLLERPSGSLSPEEIKTLGQAVAAWARTEH